jgi:tetratricopeptide (TPR) repeat protein
VDFFDGFGLNSGMAEKSIADISRDLRILYQKGNDALSRDNFDYAVDLFNQVLAKEPAFFDCRKALRAAQAKKSGESGTGFFKKMMSSAGSSPMVAKAQLTLRRNPAEAMAIAEHILNGDPNNSGAHRVILDAATTLELPRTAVLSLEILCKNSPKDKELVIQTAEALVANGEIARAEKILAEAARNFPNDPDISQTQKNLSASKTLGQGGYESLGGGEGSFRDALRNKDEAVSLEQEKRVQKSEDVTERLINEYEARLQTEPDNLKLLRSLAELYTQKKQFDLALKCYDRVKSSDMGASDATLDRAIGDTKVKRFEQQLSELNPFAPEHADEVARVRAEKIAFQLAECQKRVEKFPTDLAIRFEMGALYFQAGKIGEAIQEFQKAQNSPHKRLPAMNYLAQCFAKRKMFDLAAKTLQNAIKEKAVFDEEKKELIYNLGCVLESMGKKDEAIEQFKLIYEVDAGYKDVGAKVDAYYAGQ